MPRLLRALLFFVCLSQAPASMADSPRTVRLATLEWPPYNSEAMPGGGFNTALVREAFAFAGLRLEVVTLPWSMAVYKGMNDARFDGYFPVYLSSDVRRNCFLSERAGESPVVLATRKSSRFLVRGVSDLMQYRIGVVNGYHNTEAFDTNVRKGTQKVDIAFSDEQNLNKLAHARVDMIIIDRNVMQWLLANNPPLRGEKDMIDSMEPPLQVQGLYICFKRNMHGQQLADSFSGGLRHLDIETFTRKYMAQLRGK